MPSGSVLHVDPEASAGEELRDALADSPLEVRSAEGGEGAFEASVEGLEGHDGPREPFEVEGAADGAVEGATETWSE